MSAVGLILSVVRGRPEPLLQTDLVRNSESRSGVGAFVAAALRVVLCDAKLAFGETLPCRVSGLHAIDLVPQFLNVFLVEQFLGL